MFSRRIHCYWSCNNIKSSLGYKIIRPLIKFIIKEIQYHIPKNATTLRCLSRNAINSATKARSYHHQIFIRLRSFFITVILISMLFMLLFIIMTFFGEYLGRILNDSSKHEQYWILNEFHSSVMVNQNRQNVTYDSDFSD